MGAARVIWQSDNDQVRIVRSETRRTFEDGFICEPYYVCEHADGFDSLGAARWSSWSTTAVTQTLVNAIGGLVE